MRHRRLCYLSAALPPSIHDQCVRHCRLCHLSAALPPIIHGSIYNLRPMLLVCGVAARRSFRLNLQSFAWSRQFRAMGKRAAEPTTTAASAKTTSSSQKTLQPDEAAASLRRLGHISDDQIHDGPAFVETPATPTAKKCRSGEPAGDEAQNTSSPMSDRQTLAFKSQLRMGYLKIVLHRRLLTLIAR